MKSYNVWLYIVAKMFVIVGALNWGAMAINPEYNIFRGEQTTFKRIIYGIIGLSAIHVSLQPKTFLPFLGDCAFPVFNYIHDTTDAKLSQDGWNKLVIKMPEDEEGTKMVYWAAEPSKDDEIVENPQKAYADFENSGIADIVNGSATIAVKCPAHYKVPVAGELARHIHFRVVNKDGLLSRVYTYKNDITKLCG